MISWTWLRVWIVMLTMTLGGPVAQAADAGDQDSQGPTAAEVRDSLRGARYHLTRPTRLSVITPRIRTNIRAGRYITEVGWGLVGAATIVMPLSLAMDVYNFQGPWYKKAGYDEVFLVRRDISQGMLIATPIIGGVGALLTMIGPLIEGDALFRLKGSPRWPGFLGMGLLLAGGVVFGVEVATYLSPVAGPNLLLTGWTFIMAQYAVNAITVRRMSQPTRDELFPERQPHLRVAVGPAPVAGPGIAVFGRF